MILHRSRFLHSIPLGENRVLLVHAVNNMRLSVDAEVEAIVDAFAAPRRLPDDIPELAQRLGYGLDVLVGCIASLLERGFLTEASPEEELTQIGAQLAPLHGRDPGELLDQHRRKLKLGADPAWAVSSALGISDLTGAGRRVELLVFGDCDLQMESDFLRREAAGRNIDLRVAATFPDDVRFAEEHAHDAILIGALRARRTICEEPTDGSKPFAAYLAEAQALLEALRGRTGAPILIDALPEPTVQPLGLADRGEEGHRNRFRRANLALVRLAESLPDVHVVDVAASLSAVGAERLVDDGLVGFTHFGSPGWMLQRPADEMAGTHGVFPDIEPLARHVEGDPYGREAVIAKAHVDVLVTVLGIDRKKCVVVDLDGVLWPGVLAETGSPFAWSPEVSGPYSYVGLYFGIHEALKSLKRRGVVLACVSKNDEALVRELWTYPEHYPRDRLLTPDDFVTWRVNWSDKADNIQSIAEELGLALDSFVFIDDREVERANVQARLPEVVVLGEDLFALRRQLLNDPRLQVARLTSESCARTELVKSQLARQRLKASDPFGSDFIASLEVERETQRLAPGAPLDRVEELFKRTTQFNTTGRRFSVAELDSVLGSGQGDVFTLRVRDRFGDHGMVGAAVVVDDEIVGFAMSCRVIGLGVEQAFLSDVLAVFSAERAEVCATIIASPRNSPARNLYRDAGFEDQGEGRWRLRLGALERARA